MGRGRFGLRVWLFVFKDEIKLWSFRDEICASGCCLTGPRSRGRHIHRLRVAGGVAGLRFRQRIVYRMKLWDQSCNL